MQKAVMYGGGNIGRGFIGKVFSDSGYEVCFLDIAEPLIEEMNRRGSYTVRVVSNAEAVDAAVRNVRAVHASTEQALSEIAGCDVMATAVGVNILPKIAPVIAKGAARRMRESGRPLDILLCENQLEADKLMRGWINACLTDAERVWADENLGLVEASIGRMVPPLTPEERAKDSLLICVEPYAELPVDLAAFKGGIPALAGLVPYSPFGFYIKRKLFVHNMGHAMVAYFGHLAGFEYIWQGVADPGVLERARAAMAASGEALVREYGEAMRGNVEANIEDLLFRFGNLALRDTVSRVGADPVRKLRRNDRLVGAALYCLEQGVDPAPIVGGIAAALGFDRADDPSARELQGALREKGIDHVLEHYLGLRPDEPLWNLIRAEL